jgi:hypothetical protein
MGYINAGSRTAVGVADQTGNNSGNWTVTFDAAVFNVGLPYFEIYKILVSGAPNSTFNTYIGANQWESAQRGDNNVWNGAQQISDSMEVYFYWSDPITDSDPPTVTLWLRYDTSVKVNA